MKKRSLIFWISLTIFLVGSLPFLLSWYQIKNSNEAIIDQAQKSHMIISRATADRLGAVIEKYLNLAQSLGSNQSVYLQPDSSESSEILKSTLISQNEILTIGLYLISKDDGFKVIQLLNKKQDKLNDIESLIQKNANDSISLISDNQQNLLLINKSTARPNVSIVIIAQIDFKTFLDPSVLGQSANLYLLDPNSKIIARSGTEENILSENILQQLESKNITSSANRTHQSGSKRVIESLAKVPHTDWFIVSQQPTKFAEQIATQMSSTAKKTFLLSMVIMALLVIFAYYSWVKPIRNIIHNQRKLMGLNDSDDQWNGDEVTALELSFDALTQHINDRNALGNIFVERYQVISPIGKGGMGSVFLGWDPRLSRHVALKTLPLDTEDSFGSRQDMSQTLVQEAITAAKISHRNIVSIYDVISTKSTAFIAMEFIDGESLGSLLSRKGCLPLSMILPIIVAISRGLESAHNLGFVHRDIKPDNILLDQNGDIKLTDFGTTILLKHSIEKDFITGTSGYIAPEIYLKGEFSAKSDLFSLGVVIATCLLGENPFKGKKQHNIKYNTINKEVVFPKEIREQGSIEIFELIDSLLEKNPHKRPKSANEVADSIIVRAQQKIHWDATKIGILSAQENNYENSEETTLHINTI
jgi:hypothetical protein